MVDILVFKIKDWGGEYIDNYLGIVGIDDF